jgi:dephospho-CoA kinase
MKKRKKVLGLTGPIASGKNEAAKILKRAGAFIIDADKIGHELLSRDPIVAKKVLADFGTRDRKEIGRIVFSNPFKLKTLNRIIHPALKNRIKKNIKGSRAALVVVNAALPELFKGLTDLVILIAASKEKRLSRLAKSGLLKAEALKRMNAQLSPEGYLKIADTVILNNGTLKELKEKVGALKC